MAKKGQKFKIRNEDIILNIIYYGFKYKKYCRIQTK